LRATAGGGWGLNVQAFQGEEENSESLLKKIEGTGWVHDCEQLVNNFPFRKFGWSDNISMRVERARVQKPAMEIIAPGRQDLFTR
jgi:hypothetical protein